MVKFAAMDEMDKLTLLHAMHLCRCHHNEVYWRGDASYYAFGLGAASYLQDRRFSRPRGMGAYKQWVQDFATSGAGLPGVQALELYMA